MHMRRLLNSSFSLYFGNIGKHLLSMFYRLGTWLRLVKLVSCGDALGTINMPPAIKPFLAGVSKDQ